MSHINVKLVSCSPVLGFRLVWQVIKCPKPCKIKLEIKRHNSWMTEVGNEKTLRSPQVVIITWVKIYEKKKKKK